MFKNCSKIFYLPPGNALKPVGSLLKPDDKNIYSSTAIKKKKESESIKTVNNTLYMTYCRSYQRNIRACNLIFIVRGERLKQRKRGIIFPLKNMYQSMSLIPLLTKFCSLGQSDSRSMSSLLLTAMSLLQKYLLGKCENFDSFAFIHGDSPLFAGLC